MTCAYSRYRNRIIARINQLFFLMHCRRGTEKNASKEQNGLWLGLTDVRSALGSTVLQVAMQQSGR